MTNREAANIIESWREEASDRVADCMRVKRGELPDTDGNNEDDLRHAREDVRAFRMAIRSLRAAKAGG